MTLPDFLGTSVFVVDDFYERPLAVRKLALSVDYGLRLQRANYPGRESERSFPASGIENKFSAILARNVAPFGTGHIYGRFRFALENEQGVTDVHVDESDWTAVIYLTPSPELNGGLVFYEHRATGLTGVPDSPELKTLGYKSPAHFESCVVFPDTKNPDAWRAITLIEFKFNRCVIFRGNRLFHGISSTFGTTLSNARLTQNFFLREV